MIKSILFFLIISLCVFFTTPIIYACDPLGCLIGGNKQDTLILGEITSVKEDKQEIEIIFIFPQNQIKSLKEGDKIMLSDIKSTINLTEKESEEISVSKKYLMSLNKKDNFYIPAWGIYEIVGSNYSDAKLVTNESTDDEALEIFINSGGTKKDFAFDYSGRKPVLYVNGEVNSSETKEENTLWYIAGIGTLVLIGGLIIIFKKKK